jgi:hypothetical protein
VLSNMNGGDPVEPSDCRRCADKRVARFHLVALMALRLSGGSDAHSFTQ